MKWILVENRKRKRREEDWKDDKRPLKRPDLSMFIFFFLCSNSIFLILQIYSVWLLCSFYSVLFSDPSPFPSPSLSLVLFLALFLLSFFFPFPFSFTFNSLLYILFCSIHFYFPLFQHSSSSAFLSWLFFFLFKNFPTQQFYFQLSHVILSLSFSLVLFLTLDSIHSHDSFR